MTKTQARKLLQKDYIPKGGKIDNLRSLEFRPTEEHEIYRCGKRTGHDIQSGDIFCGDLAEWIDVTPNDVTSNKERAALCDEHAERLNVRKIITIH